MEIEVANLSRRYVVQTGEPQYVEIYDLGEGGNK